MRALLSDPDAEVQWIFMQRSLGASLLREAAAAGDDPALLARAAYIIHEPSDSEPHDDHMHVRFYCDPGDRRLGCADRGPVRWWKKMWKYMQAPYGRPPADALGAEGVAALGRLIRDELPPLFAGAPKLTQLSARVLSGPSVRLRRRASVRVCRRGGRALRDRGARSPSRARRWPRRDRLAWWSR